MSDIKAKLNSLENKQLIDVVKNFKQYGYDEATRHTAIKLLEERSITIDDLKMTGNFENKRFDDAEVCYRAFFKNSRIALIFYCLIFILNMVPIPFEPSIGQSLLLISTLVALVLYFAFLIKSFTEHNRLYKLIGNNYKTSSTTVYYLLGAPVYFIVYFIFKKQIYNEMKAIR